MVISPTGRIMLMVAACLVPGLLVEAVLIDWRVLPNAVFAAAVATATETLCLKAMRGRSLGPALDGSSLVTALIITAALPPNVAPGVLAVAVVTAVALGKYAYGGLGNNVFNPAMVGYAAVLLSFPQLLSGWPAATGAAADALSGATALTTFKYREGATVADIWLAENGFGLAGAAGWEWVNTTFLAGGLILLALRLAAWRVSVALLASLALLALAGYDGGSSASRGSPLYHWFSGGTMLAAFFVVTDPVTHPVSQRGQWLFGLLAGALIYCIRAYGSYPDGIAFAVLLANALTPYLDRRGAFAREGTR